MGIAFVLNLFLIVVELYILSKLKNKIEILKYYTYLQNFLCLIVSIIFCLFCIFELLFGFIDLELFRGLRYVVTTGLVFTSFIFFLLSFNKNNMISDDDFIGVSGKKASFILHFFCPLLSFVSFAFFEKSIILENSIWTLLVALPSCLYWIMYFVLTITKKWEEPYDFSFKKNNVLIYILMFFSIPCVFIIISILLWNIR